MRYAIVIEKAQGNYSAYVPDFPGCVATAATVEAAENEIREAIKFHLDGLKEDGQPIPSPTSIAAYAELSVRHSGAPKRSGGEPGMTRHMIRTSKSPNYVRFLAPRGLSPF